MTVNVLGAGSWGTGLAVILGRNDHEVRLMGRDPETISALRARRENLRYLPGFALPRSVDFFTFDDEWPEADLWVLAVPSEAVREVVRRIPAPSPHLVVASKGLEPGTGSTLSRVVQAILPEAPVSVLSGPNLALELVQGIPTAAVVACASEEEAERVRSAFMNRHYRIYLSDDVIGVELAGAIKNVLAIGSGICAGLGFGDNTRGALLARGLNEMARIGLALGARADTFLGVAGVGDLFATAASPLSRNFRVGRALGEGKSLGRALAEVGQVAEGVKTSEAVMILTRPLGLELPLLATLEAVIRGRLGAREAVSLLMERTPKREGLAPFGSPTR